MDIALRAVVLYAFIVFVTRVIGRRELSSLSPFDLILLIILGDVVQQGLTQDDYSVTGALIAIGTIAGLQVLTSYVGFRLPWTRRVLDGQPNEIVQDGKPIEETLHRERLTADEVAAEARVQQIESLEKVQWAVLETSGKISVIPRQ